MQLIHSGRVERTPTLFVVGVLGRVEGPLAVDARALPMAPSNSATSGIVSMQEQALERGGAQASGAVSPAMRDGNAQAATATGDRRDREHPSGRAQLNWPLPVLCFCI